MWRMSNTNIVWKAIIAFWLILKCTSLSNKVPRGINIRVRLGSGIMRRLRVKEGDYILPSIRLHYNLSEHHAIHLKDVPLSNEVIAGDDIIKDNALFICQPESKVFNHTHFLDRTSCSKASEKPYIVEHHSLTNCTVTMQQDMKEELDEFSSFLRLNENINYHVGLLYGDTITKNSKTHIKIKSMYLQPENNETHLLETAKQSIASKVASALGLRLVGLIVIHSPRSFALSSQDLLTAGALSKVTGHQFVILSANNSKSRGHLTLEPYQLSNQAMDMFKQDMFVGRNGEDVLRTGRDVSFNYEESRDVNTALLVVPVPIQFGTLSKQHKRKFPAPHSSPSSRHLVEALFARDTSTLQVAALRDFNLLLYLAEKVPLFNDFLTIVKDGTATKNVPLYYLHILQSVAGVKSP